ncbi:ring finger protein-like [Macrochelys suwanniensis]
MTAAVLRAEPPLAPAPGERGELPPPAAASQAGAAESPGESEPEAWGGEGGARPGAAPWPPALEGAREPLLDPRQAPAACGPPSPPLAGGRLCPAPAPAPAPLRPLPAAGRSPSPVAPRALPRLERSPSPPRGGPGEPAAGEAEEEEEECPICTEPYDGGRHARARLNCRHVLCGACLRAILERAGAADMGRVRCPICRQKTPMLEWEICKLQEELLLLHAQPAPASPLALPAPPPLPARRPGLCGALEHHFQVRFHTGRMFGCLPCLRYPLCLVSGLGGLQRRCRCCYLLSLAALLAAETLSLLLIFLPIVLLVLLFLILDK